MFAMNSRKEYNYVYIRKHFKRNLSLGFHFYFKILTINYLVLS